MKGKKSYFKRKRIAKKKGRQNYLCGQPSDDYYFSLPPGKSADAVCDSNGAVNYPVEFLNSLDKPGMPSNHLKLKVGSTDILLRNLNPPRLCNGTRLVIK